MALILRRSFFYPKQKCFEWTSAPPQCFHNTHASTYGNYAAMNWKSYWWVFSVTAAAPPLRSSFQKRRCWSAEKKTDQMGVASRNYSAAWGKAEGLVWVRINSTIETQAIYSSPATCWSFSTVNLILNSLQNMRKWTWYIQVNYKSQLPLIRFRLLITFGCWVT